MPDLVYIDEFGLKGESFYWQNSERYSISKDELKAIGITDGRLQVDRKIIPALLAVNEDLKKHGYELLIKDGFRSKELYRLAYGKRVKMHGHDITNKLMNMDQMPHATGLTVDVGLFDPKLNREIPTRRKEDSADSLLFGFYRNKIDEESQRLQMLQDLIKDVMLKHRFQVGVKNEYFHFNYAN